MPYIQEGNVTVALRWGMCWGGGVIFNNNGGSELSKNSKE